MVVLVGFVVFVWLWCRWCCCGSLEVLLYFVACFQNIVDWLVGLGSDVRLGMSVVMLVWNVCVSAGESRFLGWCTNTNGSCFLSSQVIIWLVYACSLVSVLLGVFLLMTWTIGCALIVSSWMGRWGFVCCFFVAVVDVVLTAYNGWVSSTT